MSETIEYKGKTIEIWNDESPMNPARDWDNASTMVCFHSGYDLGNSNHGFSKDDYESWNELKAGIENDKEVLAILPLYLMDHSGISMSTGSFSCPWDSGCVGFIFIDKAGAEMIGFDEAWAKQYYPDKTFVEALETVMVSDVKVYDDYLTGAVYGYTNEDGESCGGYFGYDHEKSGLLADAKANIDYEIKHKLKERFDKLKQYIKAKVPVIYRTLPTL